MKPIDVNKCVIYELASGCENNKDNLSALLFVFSFSRYIIKLIYFL
nr:MAG TPA: hypothetical protein [Crassvirales sp.]